MTDEQKVIAVLGQKVAQLTIENSTLQVEAFDLRQQVADLIGKLAAEQPADEELPFQV